MPVVGVASKLRQPSAVSPRPVHTALPIPSAVRAATSQGCVARQQEVRPGQGVPGLSCQLSVKPEYQQERTTEGRSRAEMEESKICKIYTDWANHYLAKSGCPRLIKDLSQDVTDGVLLAQIIQIIANEKVEDINGSPRSQTQMIENVDTCLSFLDARGVNVQGLSAEEIRNGNLKSILGLFFILSRYKQQQQQQQQYYQSLVELSQQTSSSAPSTSSPKTHDMQSSLTARYASSPGHSGIGSPQKKNTRLPGPSRVPAAGSGASRSPGSSNLNRRSQSFNSIDKSKPLQYASGNDRGSSALFGGIVSTSQSGQQLASAIPSPTTGKSWRSKSMNLKHSATSSMLASPTHSSSTTPSPQALEGPQSHGGDGSKAGSGVAPPHRSMLEKFRLIHPRSASRASPSMAEMALQEEDDVSEYGEDSPAVAVSACSSVGSTATAKQMSAKTSASALSAPSKSLSTTASYPKASGGGSRSNTQGKEDKVKSAKSSKENPSKEESTTDSSKKTSKISSLIPKGGRSSSGKKDGGSSASSCIPKPGLKAPSTTTAKPQSQTQAALTSCGNVRGSDADRAKLGKGGQGGSFYIQRSTAGQEGKRTFMTSSTSTSALAGSSGMLMKKAVQLFASYISVCVCNCSVLFGLYACRTFSENDCTTVAPADPCLSPTKGELVYSKTAKQCLEEISGEDAETRRMRTVKNIADLRQNLEETMSNLRGTQIILLCPVWSLQMLITFPSSTRLSTPRLFGTKASSKPSSPGTPDSGKCPSILGSPHGTLARQASLDSPSSGTGSLGSGGGLSGASSPLYGKTPDLCTDSLASSPASGLSLPSNSRPWPACSSSAGSKDTLSCQSMTSLHTSSESIDLPLGHHGPKVTRTGSVKSTLSEGMPLDRNTLPKKGLRYPPSSRQMSHEESKEWLRSHSTGGLQDTGSQSPLSPPGACCNPVGKYHYSNLLSPTNMSQYNLSPAGASSMSRSSSIPAQDSFDLYGDAHPLGGSATSLEERPRAISRSGSFRDSTDEVHGSSLSLVSSTSSLYSAQIRKLRRELDASQEKVATLTSQLAANSHLVAAFEKSLSNMTCRLQSLTMTAEQKESELAELRETIETLKTQNTDAQTAIQVALNGPDHLHKDLRIRRQHSSESMSSINSAASHSSMGSLGKEAEDKKKKKKSWVSEQKTSFKQAFSKKKTKSQSAHDEMEEMTDSLPSSPKLHHDNRQCICNSKFSPIWTPKKKQNGHVVYKHRSRLCECTEAEAEIILQLKNELREKELKLTDIRLEALSSAHHLDQIREAMNRMQNEIEILKAENDRLKSSGNATPTATPVKTARPPSETSSTSSSSSRQSLGLSLNNLNITDTIMSEILLDDGFEGNLRKEGRSVRIVVSINSGPYTTKVCNSLHDYLIGSIGVSGKTKWDVMDGVIRRLFKEYVFRVDPITSLGLSSDSIVSYRMGEVVRSHGSEVPELLPCGYLVGDSNVIKVNLKGMKENSIDSLVFDTLIPKPIVQRYLNLLMEHRRIILSGPSGTGKSFLAAKLAKYIMSQMGQEVTEHNVASFNVDQNSSKELQQYMSNLAEQCNSEDTDVQLPTVVILDNLHHIGSLSDIFNGFLNCKYHKCPYVIGTMSQGVSSSPNLELHHNFRWVLCTNHTEPVKGFLGRFLRRKLIETEIDKNMRSNDLIKIVDWIPKTWHHLNSFLEAHSSSDVTIGPRLFLPCPMDVEGSRVWFTDLWNYSLVPYLLEAVREGLQLYGKRAVWEDPSKWVNDTYPWSAPLLQQDGQSLLQLRPEDVGYDGYSSSKEGASAKQVSQSDTEGDPLMNMLLRLQEAANYSSTQSCDSDSTSHHDDQLDSSLESAL
uniref:Neuron navigator 3 n=1 Tax=Oryzias sinensis TaxID=183150 RepID=A0A8C8DNX0_9TELE